MGVFEGKAIRDWALARRLSALFRPDGMSIPVSSEVSSEHFSDAHTTTLSGRLPLITSSNGWPLCDTTEFRLGCSISRNRRILHYSSHFNRLIIRSMEVRQSGPSTTQH